ncbi:MAG: branched-chain amino acid ABC transporter permease [Alphaproteobacteria bacterium]
MSAVLQLVVNGVLAGSVLALPAIGLTTIFAVLRHLNFALGAHMTIGAFAGFAANVYWGLPPYLALPFAFVVAGLSGVASDELALKPLRRYGALTVAIASIALGLFLENLVRFFFGNALRSYDIPILRDWTIGPFRVGPQEVQDLAVAAAIMALLFVFLAATSLGKRMRAVADNPTLADIKGIDPERMGRLANFLGMGLGGVGGMLLGLATSVEPELGFNALLSVFAAAVVGGLGSVPGAVAGALAIGLAEELSLLVLPATYRSAVGFAAILVVLAFRPRGLLGARTAG